MMDGSRLAVPPAVFDPSETRASGLRPRLREWLLDRLPLLYSVARVILPTVRVRGVVLASRRDDVEAILSNHGAFQSRVGARIAELQANAGILCPPPVLGLGSDDPAIHSQTMKSVAQAVRLTDTVMVGAIVRSFVAPHVREAGAIDAGSLLLRAPAHLAREYYGLDVEDAALGELALCCISLVLHSFLAGKLDSPSGRLGRGAAAKVSAIVRRSIDRQRPRPRPDTVIGRLLLGQMDDTGIESMLTVLMMALVAVPAVAAINILRLLLRRPEAMRLTRAAAQAGDDARLERCAVEALRLNPGLLGLLRDCSSDCTIGDGRGAVRARAHDLVVPLIHSAMLDRRRVVEPKAFNPDRPASDSLGFGFGLHFCAGFAIGRAQLVHTLKPLLLRGVAQTSADRAAISYFGAIAEHLPVHLG